jgi:molybdopterin converting factor small subunit
MTKVSVNLYGAFRQLGVGQISLEVPDSPTHSAPNSTTVASLRVALETYLQQRTQADKSSIVIPRQLLQASVFASDRAVLRDEDSVGDSSTLSLFPPVCGG